MESRSSKILHSSTTMDDDRISSLPEELRCHILSFLPTKNAVATSVLSKKWKSVWCSVPTLDIDDAADYRGRSAEDHAHFVESVHAFILSRNLHQPIQKFRLRFFNPRDSEDHTNVRACVKSAVQHLVDHARVGVQHLDIALPYPWIIPSQPKRGLRPPTFISPVIFTCTNLVVLKLDGLRFEPLSSVVGFPFLKTLHLKDLLFSKRECLVQLLSGCPLLEDFKEIRVYFHRGVDFTGGEFVTLPKLLRAELSVEYPRFLLKAVNNVQFLHIHEIDGRILHNVVSTKPSVFPMFHNLIHIELSYRNRNKDWVEVVEVIKYCPQLQVLVINQKNYNLPKFIGLGGKSRDWQCPQSVPECILLHLKRCSVNEYRGTNGEFQFARYIMQHGRFLESMTICSSSDINPEGKLKNLKELSSCTRQSATCKLSFE